MYKFSAGVNTYENKTAKEGMKYVRKERQTNQA